MKGILWSKWREEYSEIHWDYGILPRSGESYVYLFWLKWTMFPIVVTQEEYEMYEVGDRVEVQDANKLEFWVRLGLVLALIVIVLLAMAVTG